MSNCTCTPAHFLYDENQWEPGVKCSTCIEEGIFKQEMDNSMLRFPENPVHHFPEVIPTIPAEDGLPF